MTRFRPAPSGLLFVLVAPVVALLATQDALQTSPAAAASAEEAGLKIAEEARARGEGFGNFTAWQAVALRNKQGQESRRQLRFKVLEVAGDGNKSIFVFDEPRDVKGTALLIHAHRSDDDEQWLYLPALKRVKRISSSNRSGSFMGSEFAYEDMSTQEVEKFTHRYLRDEPCGDLTCTVSERVPVGKGSGYSRQLIWHDRDELRVWRCGILRPQGRASEDADARELRALPGSLLAGRRDDDGQSSDGQEHRAHLDGLSVRHRSR